jgi:hypothetical protein
MAAPTANVAVEVNLPQLGSHANRSDFWYVLGPASQRRCGETCALWAGILPEIVKNLMDANPETMPAFGG